MVLVSPCPYFDICTPNTPPPFPAFRYARPTGCGCLVPAGSPVWFAWQYPVVVRALEALRNKPVHVCTNRLCCAHPFPSPLLRSTTAPDHIQPEHSAARKLLTSFSFAMCAPVVFRPLTVRCPRCKKLTRNIRDDFESHYKSAHPGFLEEAGPAWENSQRETASRGDRFVLLPFSQGRR